MCKILRKKRGVYPTKSRFYQVDDKTNLFVSVDDIAKDRGSKILYQLGYKFF